MSAADLLALTEELVAVPSVSRQEKALADVVQAMLEGCRALDVVRVGDNVVARTELGRPQRVIVAGHLDTVPPAGNDEPRREGDTLSGVGTADMKGGLAVMADLARSLSQPALDVTWCFYACEEIARDANGLHTLWAMAPDLLRADVAILAEPTDARVEAGCQGTLRAAVHLAGRRAHTARPFTGRNAIHRLAPVLERVASWKGRTVDLDGCRYTEQLQAVGVEGGVAPNVVPDQASVTLNHRFAPDHAAAAARRFLEALLEGVLDPGAGDRIEVVDAADGAPPALGHPVLSALVAHSAQAPQGKVGWTDVATMWAHGIPAANFGPGDPLVAHRPDEHVTGESLARAHRVLTSVLMQEPAPPAAR